MEKYFTKITRDDFSREWQDWRKNINELYLNFGYFVSTAHGPAYDIYQKSIIDFLMTPTDIENLEQLLSTKDNFPSETPGSIVFLEREYLAIAQSDEEGYVLQKKCRTFLDYMTKQEVVVPETIWVNDSPFLQDLNRIGFQYKNSKNKLQSVFLQFFNLPDEWFYIDIFLVNKSFHSYYRCDGFYGFKKLVELELKKF